MNICEFQRGGQPGVKFLGCGLGHLKCTVVEKSHMLRRKNMVEDYRKESWVIA